MRQRVRWSNPLGVEMRMIVMSTKWAVRVGRNMVRRFFHTPTSCIARGTVRCNLLQGSCIFASAGQRVIALVGAPALFLAMAMAQETRRRNNNAKHVPAFLVIGNFGVGHDQFSLVFQV